MFHVEQNRLTASKDFIKQLSWNKKGTTDSTRTPANFTIWKPGEFPDSVSRETKSFKLHMKTAGSKCNY